MLPPPWGSPATHLPPGHDPYHSPQLGDKSLLQVQQLKEVVGLEERKWAQRSFLKGERGPGQKSPSPTDPHGKAYPSPPPQVRPATPHPTVPQGRQLPSLLPASAEEWAPLQPGVGSPQPGATVQHSSVPRTWCRDVHGESCRVTGLMAQPSPRVWPMGGWKKKYSCGHGVWPERWGSPLRVGGEPGGLPESLCSALVRGHPLQPTSLPCSFRGRLPSSQVWRNWTRLARWTTPSSISDSAREGEQRGGGPSSGAPASGCCLPLNRCPTGAGGGGQGNFPGVPACEDPQRTKPRSPQSHPHRPDWPPHSPLPTGIPLLRS